MANDTQANAPQVGANADTQPQAGGDTHAPQGQEPQVFDAEYVGKLRTEAASYRTRLSNAEKRLKEIEDGQLSEMQKLQKQLEAISHERDALAHKARQSDAMSAAARAGAKYPDAVARLVPDDSTDFDSAVKDIRKSYPDMFRTSDIDAGRGNGQDNGHAQDMNQIIRRRMEAGRN